jgi:integrase
MPNVKLTEAFVAKIDSSSETIFWDTELTGLGLRVWVSGKKVYIVQHRNKQTQKLHKITLGNANIVALKKARELASTHIYECNSDSISTGIKGIYLADLCKLYLNERKGKKNSLDQDEWNIKKYILPTLGNKIVKNITLQDLIDLQNTLYPHKVTVNRVRGILSLLFSFAIDMNYAKENPARKLRNYPEYKKTVYLSLEDIEKLWHELNLYELKHPRAIHLVNAIRLLLLTGARMREITNLTWYEVDFSNKVINLGDRKTEKKYIYLSDKAIEVLQNIPRRNEMVIPGYKKGNTNIWRVWVQVRNTCEFDKKITLHTLRHTYASLAVSKRIPLPIVGELLGHNSLRSTQIYAHLYADVVKNASDMVGSIMHETVGGK